MVEQVFANDGGTGAVEIHCRDVAGIVRDEEVAIDGGQHAKQYGAGNAKGIGQRQHSYNDGTLTVDEHTDCEERKGDGPGLL